MVNCCRFCLNAGSLCIIRLTKGKGSKAAAIIDMAHSRCPNLARLSLTSAAASRERSPCTNHLMTCPLCFAGSNAVWKYNMLWHIETVHSGEDIEKFRDQYTIKNIERTHLGKIKDANKKKRYTKKDKIVSTIKISPAHCSSQALQ